MATKLTPEEWDRQFIRQAAWTEATRAHLYRRANLLRAKRVLDVGSGTGAGTQEICARTDGQVVGVDIDPVMVDYATRQHGCAVYHLGDAHDLDFRDAWFDITACHFVLMWCRDAARAAGEMVRVTRPGGSILVCAEPDYGGRIDYPDVPLAHWQSEALRSEGADPCLGRKLRGLFTLPAVREVQVGVIPGLWDPAMLHTQFNAEWALWERLLTGRVPGDELACAKTTDRAAIDSGVRLAFVPVFYALVRV